MEALLDRHSETHCFVEGPGHPGLRDIAHFAGPGAERDARLFAVARYGVYREALAPGAERRDGAFRAQRRSTTGRADEDCAVAV